ncbi:hypothetical protein [Stenotrophomonas maltophilia]|uniref:hypothetical protein n=1 Tax=Stenotrophomonas maltophilia TaxID=40324 RepID=UPI000F67E63B|nr:hypothetical protein [Stenotrophomonas maltophilia]
MKRVVLRMVLYASRLFPGAITVLVGAPCLYFMAIAIGNSLFALQLAPDEWPAWVLCGAAALVVARVLRPPKFQPGIDEE